MKILGTGLSGLVGSRFVELYSDIYDLQDMSLDTGVDITNKSEVTTLISACPAPCLIHFAAKTDVDDCERERFSGKRSQAWKVNVLGTKHVVDACIKYNKKIIYISTDFVFDGKKDSYSEDDIPSPVSFYAQTKWEGEEIVKKSKDYIICRISFPYRANFEKKLDLVRTMLQRMQAGQNIQAIEDQLIVPTFIDDIARALHTLISRNEKGIFHVVGSEAISPYNLAKKIANIFGFTSAVITRATREAYFRSRAHRSYKTILKNDKIVSLGVKMLSVTEGLKAIKRQGDVS